MGAEDLIAVQLRLIGGTAYAAGMQEGAAANKEFGESAAAAGASAKEGAVGVDALGASSKTASGSMSAMKAQGTQMKSLGSSLTKLTLPIALIGGLSIKSSLDFQHSMEQIHTQAGASEGELNNMTKSVLAFAASGQSAHGPDDLANSLFHLESIGLRGAKAMSTLRKAEALATTGSADMESTTNALAGALSSHVKGAENATKATGTLNAIIGAGNLRMNDLNSALGTGILARANTLGISLPQVGASLATLTAQGMPAAASMTRMGMAMNMMMSPTAKAKSALADIGLQSDQLGVLMQKGKFPQALDLLNTKLQGLGGNAEGRTLQANAISSIFGGGRTSGGITSILKGLDDFHSKLNQINQQGSPKVFDDLHKAAMQNDSNRLKVAWAQLQATFVHLGDVLRPIIIPMILGFAHGLGSLLTMFDKLPGPVKTVGVALLLLLAVAGPIITMLGVMGIALAALGVEMTFLEASMAVLDVLASPWVLLALAIVAVGVGLVLLYTKVKWFRDAVNAVVDFIKDHWKLMAIAIFGPWGAALVLVVTHFNKVKNAAINVFNWIKGHWKLLILVFGPVGVAIDILVTHFQWVKTAAVNTFNWIKTAVTNTAQWMSNAWNNVGTFLAKPFNWLETHVASILKWIMDKINAIPDAVSGVWNSIPGHGVVDSATGAVSHFITGNARGGTITDNNVHLVGEEGPELATFPIGTHISTAPQTRSILNSPSSPLPGRSTFGEGGMSGAGRDIVIHQHTYLDGREIAKSVTRHSEDKGARK